MHTSIVALAFGLSTVSALPTGAVRRDSGDATGPDADLCALDGTCIIESTAVPSASSVKPFAYISKSAANTSVVIPCPTSTAPPNDPDTNDTAGHLSVFDGFKRWIGLSNRDTDTTSVSAEASCGTVGSFMPTDEATTVTGSDLASTSTLSAFAPSGLPTLKTSGHLGVFSGFKRRARLSNRDADSHETSAPGTNNDISIFKDRENIPAWSRDVRGTIERRDVGDLDAVPVDDSEAVSPNPTSTPTFTDYASSVSTSALQADNLEDTTSLSLVAPGWARRGVRAPGSSRKVRRDV